MQPMVKQEELELLPGEKFQGWANFAKEYTGASKVGPLVPAGRYIDVEDKKFQGDGLVVLRKSDLEKLISRTRTSTTLSKIILTISKIVSRVRSDEDSRDVIDTIKIQASLGSDFALKPVEPVYENVGEMFSSELDDEFKDGDFTVSRKERKQGVIIR